MSNRRLGSAREFALVAAAVAVTEVVTRLFWLHDWTEHSLRRWPWLLERYGLLFPFFLVVFLFALRRSETGRSSLAGAILVGCLAGMAAGCFSLVAAQVLTGLDREKLWNTVRRGDGGVFVLLQVGAAFGFTLSWVHGVLASCLSWRLDRWLSTKLGGAGRQT